ncbi:MAG: hypothetical protein QOI41_4630 [Myxococcales bacterium]|nr:hypothetical protein [Myxococcales bacterium]
MNDHDAKSPDESRATQTPTLPYGRRGWLVAAALMSAVIGVSAGCTSSLSATADDAGAATSDEAGTPTADAAGPPMAADGGSNVRSPPSQGGAVGTIDSVSAPSFTMTTGAGQKVTVNETSSTTYWNGTTPTAASVIATGEAVLVLGIVSSTTITGTQVTVEPNDGGGTAASAAAGVVPFQQGAPSAAKQDGQIPANYTEGQGTIVSGTTADQATQAALAAYPGVVVDRVVQLSSGDYEVHCIGVNWPHHVFLDQNVKVTGAN